MPLSLDFSLEETAQYSPVDVAETQRSAPQAGSLSPYLCFLPYPFFRSSILAQQIRRSVDGRLARSARDSIKAKAYYCNMLTVVAWKPAMAVHGRRLTRNPLSVSDHQ